MNTRPPHPQLTAIDVLCIAFILACGILPAKYVSQHWGEAMGWFTFAVGLVLGLLALRTILRIGR